MVASFSLGNQREALLCLGHCARRQSYDRSPVSLPSSLSNSPFPFPFPSQPSPPAPLLFSPSSFNFNVGHLHCLGRWEDQMTVAGGSLNIFEKKSMKMKRPHMLPCPKILPILLFGDHRLSPFSHDWTPTSSPSL